MRGALRASVDRELPASAPISRTGEGNLVCGQCVDYRAAMPDTATATVTAHLRMEEFDREAGRPVRARRCAYLRCMTRCIACEARPALVCDECRRALCLLDRPFGFASIARHPQSGRDCRLCESGEASLCVECLCRLVLDARKAEPYLPLSLEDVEAHPRYEL